MLLQRPHTHCGGHWAAAANQARRREKQEVTGRYFLTDARHGGPVAALNQIRTGERYSYALTLGLAAAAQHAGVGQYHIDIMCLWAKWFQRVNNAVQQLEVVAHGPDTTPDPEPAADPNAVQDTSRDADVVQDLAARMRGPGRDLLRARLVHSAAHGALHAQPCQVRRL